VETLISGEDCIFENRAASAPARFATPLDCERAARRAHSASAEEGWKELKSCAAKSSFTLLEELISPAWARDLRARPDAAALLGRVIANRGGPIARDLGLLHAQRIPLFSLEDSVSAPQVYAGHPIVLRGRVNEVRQGLGSLTAKVEELALRSEAFDAPVGYGIRSLSTVGVDKGTPSYFADRRTYRTIRRYDNVSEETGQEALLRLPAPDPFLEPGRELIIIARFEGMRAKSNSLDDAEPELIPVLSLISYSEPSALLIY
jgi:hypothetical protein